MLISNRQAAEQVLLRHGYYRLAGYFYPLRQPHPPGMPGRRDDFQPGTSLSLVEALSEFDKGLRLLVLDAVERIEIAVRCDIAYWLGKRHRLAHEVEAQLDAKFCADMQASTGQSRFAEWRSKLDGAVRKASKEDFVKHHAQNYGGKMPIWVIVELWDFGLLSKFFAGMQYKDQTYIPKRYGLSAGKYLESWLRSFNFVRNVSAHHSRLWNRNIVDRPRLPPTQPHQYLHHLVNNVHAETRVYAVLCLLRMMLKAIVPDNNWHERLKAHCLTFPDTPLGESAGRGLSR
jgi:abortive infection bacteriophage resistance protein